MRLTGHLAPRDEAQEIMWSAIEVIHDDQKKAACLCRKAIEIYPDCIDALTMLAEIETELVRDYVDRMREAVEAGRRDLGAKCFKEGKGHFWGLIETRPFMRTMAMLSDALIEWGTAEAVDEAIEIHEEMLALNPNDNQGIRDWLAGCYLVRRRYNDASALFERYPDDWLAAPAWAKVLCAYVTEGEDRAAELLIEARERNPYVEDYLTGRKRRPRTRVGVYSPGDQSEAVYCADMLWEAWKKHPEARKWLKEAGMSGQCRTGPVRAVKRTPAGVRSAHPRQPDPADAKAATTIGQERIIEPKPRNTGSDRSDADGDGNIGCNLREMMDEVPDSYAARFTDIVGLLDAFCDVHLNTEYRDMCREMALPICQNGSPVLKGKPESWAAGIVYAVGRVNFLTDPSQTPHLKSKQIAEGFGVSVATMQAKAKIIREGLDLMPFDPDWTLPSRMEDNPLVWMLEVNGLSVDIRMAPREAQVVAYENGLIPFIPADRGE